MFVIFGNGHKEYTEAKGKFYCPSCKLMNIYLVKKKRDFFRIFFIPILPIGEKSQPYVECQKCKTNWDISVLDDNNYYLDGSSVIN